MIAGEYLMKDLFRDLSWPDLVYCSAGWCSAHYLHLVLLDRLISCDRFLSGGVFECNIAHLRSVPALYMLFKIRCKPMHRLYGALPVQYIYTCQCELNMVLCSLIDILMNLLAFIHQSVSVWNNLCDPQVDGKGIADFKR